MFQYIPTRIFKIFAGMFYLYFNLSNLFILRWRFSSLIKTADTNESKIFPGSPKGKESEFKTGMVILIVGAKEHP